MSEVLLSEPGFLNAVPDRETDIFAVPAMEERLRIVDLGSGEVGFYMYGGETLC